MGEKMTRIERLQQKHGRIGRLGSEGRAERRTPQRLINITERTEKIKETIGLDLKQKEEPPPLSSTTLPTSPTSPNWLTDSKEVKQ